MKEDVFLFKGHYERSYVSFQRALYKELCLFNRYFKERCVSFQEAI